MDIREQLIERHNRVIDELFVAVEQMKTGRLKTYHNDQDSTQQSIDQSLKRIEVLQEANTLLKQLG